MVGRTSKSSLSSSSNKKRKVVVRMDDPDSLPMSSPSTSESGGDIADMFKELTSRMKQIEQESVSKSKQEEQKWEQNASMSIAQAIQEFQEARSRLTHTFEMHMNAMVEKQDSLLLDLNKNKSHVKDILNEMKALENDFYSFEKTSVKQDVQSIQDAYRELLVQVETDICQMQNMATDLM